jgi:hypothetical protein
MRYLSAAAFRKGLEDRLGNQSRATSVEVDRLRRRVIFERLLARLARSDDADWVLKGGMALEVRLGNRARATRDLDLALRGVVPQGKMGEWIRSALVEALSIDHDGDGFEFSIVGDQPILPKAADQDGWRFRIDARLAGRIFERVRTDIVPDPERIAGTDRLRLPALLSFAGIEAVEIDVVNRREHFAEKLHALTRPRFRPNTRVKDLADLLLLIDEGLVADADLLKVTSRVFAGTEPFEIPAEIADPPELWRESYGQLVTDLELPAKTLDEAMTALRAFWTQVLAAAATADKES